MASSQESEKRSREQRASRPDKITAVESACRPAKASEIRAASWSRPHAGPDIFSRLIRLRVFHSLPLFGSAAQRFRAATQTRSSGSQQCQRRGRQLKAIGGTLSGTQGRHRLVISKSAHAHDRMVVAK